MKSKQLLAAAALMLSPLAAVAGTYTATISGAPGSTVVLPVTFAGDGATTETEVTFSFDNTNITLSNPVASNGAVCLMPTATTIRIVPPSGGVTPLTGTATTYCSYDVAINGAAADGLIAFNTASIECFDASASAQACTVAAGAGVNVATASTPLTLSYAPNFGSTVTFAGGGLVGAAAPSQTITATAAGNSGTATLSACGITGAGAAAFSVAPTSLNFAAAGSADLTLGCTHAAAASTATLTCTETDADNAAPGVARTWNLSCPAGGVPDVNPTITSNPPSGGTVTVSGGSVTSLGVGTIDFTAAGGSGAGSTTIDCTASGGAVVALAPGNPAGTTANQTVTGANPAVDVRVGVTLTDAAQPAAGTVSCVLTGGTNATFTYTIAAPAGAVFSAPAVIPSASTWSKIALFGLLGAFGLLAVGFRRQG